MIYQVGDRVQYITDEKLAPCKLAYQGWNKYLLGQYGVILGVIQSRYAVEFERKFPSGHACNEIGEYGHCYWVKSGFLLPIKLEVLSYEEML